MTATPYLSLVLACYNEEEHLAASFGVPTVAVFLASDPRRNGPLGPATAVVSGAGEVGAAPTASARAPRVRAVEADGIVAAARRLLAR